MRRAPPSQGTSQEGGPDPRPFVCMHHKRTVTRGPHLQVVLVQQAPGQEGGGAAQVARSLRMLRALLWCNVWKQAWPSELWACWQQL